MKFPDLIKPFLEKIVPKGYGPRMSTYAAQYNSPARKAARKAATKKRHEQIKERIAAQKKKARETKKLSK